MMNELQLNNLIKNVDGKILKYNSNFSSLSKYFNKNYPNSLSITIFNERTMSFVCNFLLFDELKKSGFNINILVNELSIKLLNALSKSTLNCLIKEAGNVKPKTKLNSFYVDGYLQVEDLYYSGINNVFIEYKMNKKFIFADLAFDYLKYKVYTNSNDNNSMFAYIIFSKSKNYPSIISSTTLYCLLNKSITISSLTSSNVFIYLKNNKNNAANSNSSNNGQDNNGNKKLIKEIIVLLDKIKMICDKLLISENIGELKIDDESEKLLIAIKNLNINYNMQIINENFSFISTIVNKINISEYEKINLNKKDLVDYLKNFSLDFEKLKYIFESFRKKIEESFNEKSISAFESDSLFLLCLLDYYKENTHISDMKPFYYKRTGNESYIINYGEVYSKFKEVINDLKSNSYSIEQIVLLLTILFCSFFKKFYTTNEVSKTFDKSNVLKLLEYGYYLMKYTNQICTSIECRIPSCSLKEYISKYDSILKYIVIELFKKIN